MKSQPQFTIVPNNPSIRYAIVSAKDLDENERYYSVSMYRFEVLKRPYFFGLLGKKKWCSQGNWATYEYGLDWAKKVLNREIYKKPILK